MARHNGRVQKRKKPVLNASFLPFLQIVGELHPSKRQILIPLLNDRACQALSHCVKLVLEEGKATAAPNVVKRLKKCLTKNKLEFKHILDSDKKSVQRKALTTIGGNPLAFLIASAIPMLVNLLK